MTPPRRRRRRVTIPGNALTLNHAWVFQFRAHGRTVVEDLSDAVELHGDWTFAN